MTSNGLERDSDADRSKASFKLDLIETVNADPKMQASDLKLVVAHLSVMSWPKRTAWLSISRARAMTGLSERQIINSRKRVRERGYLSVPPSDPDARVFTLENPRRDDMRQHVAILMDHLKNQQAERQAERRRHAKAVTANSADTEEAMSQSPSECDVSANFAGYYPSYPSEYSSEGRTTPENNSYASVSGDDPHLPFPAPETEAEAVTMLTEIFGGADLGPAFFAYFRKRLLEGKLTPADVDQHRRAVA
jgi:hypothetical protein